MANTHSKRLNGVTSTALDEGFVEEDYFQLDYFQSDYFQTGVLNLSGNTTTETVSLNPDRRTTLLTD